MATRKGSQAKQIKLAQAAILRAIQDRRKQVKQAA